MAKRYWEFTPRQSIEAECARRGTGELIQGCADLLTGGDADPGLVVALGGPHAERVLAGGPRDDQRYWLRVWAARGLLWAWTGAGGEAGALGALSRALDDPEWRVREMACKVIARHRLGDLLPAVLPLRTDPVPRVRAAALRAVTMLTGAGA